MFEYDTDAAFDLKKTSEYILSIQVSLDGFSFSVAQADDHRLLAFKHTPVKISSLAILSRHLDAWAQQETLLQQVFRKTRLVVFDPRFSLIPEAFYRDDMKEAVSQTLLGRDDDLNLAENFVKKLKARLIFALPAGLNEIAQKHFEGCEIIHPLKLVLNNLPETEQKHSLLLLFDAQNFYIVLSEQNRVLLVNNYKSAHIADVVYFALNTLQQFEIEPRNTELFLSGSCAATESMAKGLLPYFDNISFLKPSSEIQNPELAGNSFLRYFTPI